VIASEETKYYRAPDVGGLADWRAQEWKKDQVHAHPYLGVGWRKKKGAVLPLVRHWRYLGRARGGFLMKEANKNQCRGQEKKKKKGREELGSHA